MSTDQGEDRVYVALTREPLALAPLLAFVERPQYGGVVTFTGNVRRDNRGRRVLSLEYDAYVPMAERELRRIALAAAERWGGRVAAVHRLGRLEVGEPSVMIAVACAHRAEAFAACRFVIDTLKQTVPIQKKEVWEGGEVWIEGDHDAPPNE